MLNKKVIHTVIISENLLRIFIIWRFLRSFGGNTYIGKNRVKGRRVKAHRGNILVKFIVDPKFIINYIIFLLLKGLNTFI